MFPVTEPTDAAVLIPRVRRLIDGPLATGSGAVESTLGDGEITALIADAVADIILCSGGTFGHTLVVAERDATYQAPVAWRIEPVLEEHEVSVVAAQAALSHMYRVLTDRKMSEDIKDEGQSWSYQLSASVVRDWLKYLQDMRDRALESLARGGMATDVVTSMLGARDAQAASVVESWVDTST